MLTQPSNARLLEQVRATLSQEVLPAVNDPVVRVTLQAIDAVLNSVSHRCESEIDWMIEEIKAIKTLSAEMAKDGEIAAALAELNGLDETKLTFSAVQRRYNIASELLSLCAERAVLLQPVLHRRVNQLLGQRLDRERAIGGNFQVVGKT